MTDQELTLHVHDDIVRIENKLDRVVEGIELMVQLMLSRVLEDAND